MKTLDILMFSCSSPILSEGQAEAQLCLSGNEKGDRVVKPYGWLGKVLTACRSSFLGLILHVYILQGPRSGQQHFGGWSPLS